MNPDAEKTLVDAPRRRELSVDEYVSGVCAGDRAILGRAITLIESRKPEHRILAQEVLSGILPQSGKSRRIGITGVPGAGKSVFIENFGKMLAGDGPHGGHKVAVLAVDPSSAVSGGSILGDKTRMVELSQNPGAFIRPTPSAGALGGVAARTRETMLLFEAAGFDVVLIETVGVGQSETVVAEMVDFFLALMLPGAGDELQGIKRGLLELVDAIAVNKADGSNEAAAKRARAEYENALHYMRPASRNWSVPALTCSGLESMGLDDIWAAIKDHRAKMEASGEFAARRRRQALHWMWSLVEDELMRRHRMRPAAESMIPELERRVLAGEITPTFAAEQALDAMLGERSP